MALFAKRRDAPYFFENPETGLLKTRKVVKDIPYHKVTYCKYTAAEDPCCAIDGASCPICEYRQMYPKPTAIWTNTAWRHGIPSVICFLVVGAFCVSYFTMES